MSSDWKRVIATHVGVYHESDDETISEEDPVQEKEDSDETALKRAALMAEIEALNLKDFRARCYRSGVKSGAKKRSTEMLPSTVTNSDKQLLPTNGAQKRCQQTVQKKLCQKNGATQC